MKKNQSPVPLVKKRPAPVADDDPEEDLLAADFQLLCLTLRIDSEYLIRFGDVLGNGYVTSLDSLVNMPNLAQRRVLLAALEKVGRDFDDARDGVWDSVLSRSVFLLLTFLCFCRNRLWPEKFLLKERERQNRIPNRLSMTRTWHNW